MHDMSTKTKMLEKLLDFLHLMPEESEGEVPDGAKGLEITKVKELGDDMDPVKEDKFVTEGMLEDDQVKMTDPMHESDVESEDEDNIKKVLKKFGK